MYFYTTSYSFDNDVNGFGPFTTHAAAWTAMMQDVFKEIEEGCENVHIDEDQGIITAALGGSSGKDTMTWRLVKTSNSKRGHDTMTRADLAIFLQTIDQYIDSTNESTQIVMKTLTDILNASNSYDIRLTDLSSYNTSILWRAKDDIQYLIDTHAYDDDIKSLSEKARVINDAAERIDWEEIEDACTSVGNEIITRAIDQAIAALKQKG